MFVRVDSTIDVKNQSTMTTRVVYVACTVYVLIAYGIYISVWMLTTAMAMINCFENYIDLSAPHQTHIVLFWLLWREKKSESNRSNKNTDTISVALLPLLPLLYGWCCRRLFRISIQTWNKNWWNSWHPPIIYFILFSLSPSFFLSSILRFSVFIVSNVFDSVSVECWCSCL